MLRYLVLAKRLLTIKNQKDKKIKKGQPMQKTPLTNEQLREAAPTLFTQEPHYEVSDKYHFIPTIDIIEEIKSHNWYPMSVVHTHALGHRCA